MLKKLYVPNIVSMTNVTDHKIDYFDGKNSSYEIFKFHCIIKQKERFINIVGISFLSDLTESRKVSYLHFKAIQMKRLDRIEGFLQSINIDIEGFGGC